MSSAKITTLIRNEMSSTATEKALYLEKSTM
jgi:hypothetical protein